MNYLICKVYLNSLPRSLLLSQKENQEEDLRSRGNRLGKKTEYCVPRQQNFRINVKEMDISILLSHSLLTPSDKIQI